MKVRTVAFFLVLILGAGCRESRPPVVADVKTPGDLAAHSKEFERGVVTVTDGVHVAIGYGLANSILLEGEDGVIVVDTMESVERGRAVAEAFRKVTTKPVRAIVYTHNHTDHVFGARAFVPDGETVDVYAHETTNEAIDRIVTEYRPITTVRSLRMFGTFLDEEGLVNCGIGPFLGFGPESTLGLIRPTRTFTDRLEGEVAGIRFELVHAPGETDDQLFVWLPDKKVLLPGDNFYRAFPNLYTIRGTPFRSLKSWVSSLDRMRALRPEHLVPSHTRPLSGAENVTAALTDYRDAIRYVHDQAVRGINRGLTPDELVGFVKLPPHLAASPYLQEFYGTVEWSVRSVFAGNLGWFDGNPATLEPLSPGERARRTAGLAGGEEKLREALLEASRAGEHQWVLELSDHALRLRPDDAEVVEARVRALVALGGAASNPNARHYYLTVARELAGEIEIRPVSNANPDFLRQMPTRRFLDALAVNLRAEDALDLEQKVGLELPDTEEAFTIWIRRGVIEIREGLMDGLDLHARMDSLVWKEILAERRSAAVAIVKDIELVRGSKLGFTRWLALFRA